MEQRYVRTKQIQKGDELTKSQSTNHHTQTQEREKTKQIKIKRIWSDTQSLT